MRKQWRNENDDNNDNAEEKERKRKFRSYFISSFFFVILLKNINRIFKCTSTYIIFLWCLHTLCIIYEHRHRRRRRRILGCVFDFAYGMMAFIKHEAFGLEARPRSCVTAQAQAQQVCKSQVKLVESSLDIKVFNCSVF